MDKTVVSDFYFDDYQINNISFKLNDEFDSEEVPVDFDVESNIITSEEQYQGKVLLKLVLWDKPKKNNYPFRVEMEIIGFFSADETMDNEQFKEMCKYNGSAALFPFLRSALTDIIKVSNFGPPVVLPLININNMLKQQEEKYQD